MSHLQYINMYITYIPVFYSVNMNEVLLIDDDPINVSDTDGLFPTFAINPKMGFLLPDFFGRFNLSK